MKSFLENRESIRKKGESTGKISAGAGFAPLGIDKKVEPEAVEQPPEMDPDAPKVEMVREDDIVTHIIVSFGEKQVEIKLDY